MFKGCMFIAIFLAALVVIFGVLLRNMLYRNAPAMLLLGIETSIADYKAAHPEAVIPVENAAWAEALTSDSEGTDKAKLDDHVQNGVLVDAQGQAIRLVENSDGSISALSPGDDGAFDTEDDVSSVDLPAYLRP